MSLHHLKEDAFSITDDLLKKHGPRLAGSKASLDAADDLYERLNTFSDQAFKEDFYVYQGAFLGWIKILVVCYLLGVVALFINMPWVTMIFALGSIGVLVLQFFLYLPIVDVFYPKKLARNVYGVLEPTKEVKRQIMISGHHDSAHVFNFFIHQPKLFALRTTGSIACIFMLLMSALLLVFIKDNIFLTRLIQIVVSIGFLLVGQMWFFSSAKAAPGAGDNLIASAIALSLGKHFKSLRDQGLGLKHTRLIFMSFDAEEEGLRGSRAYALKHQASFKDVKTYMLNIECLYDENEMFFLTSDLNDFVKLDQELIKDLKDVAQTLDIKVKEQRLSFLTGGTDAAELAKKGVSATTIVGMPWTNRTRGSVYHTPHDTIDHVSSKAVLDTLSIYEKFIKEKDQSPDA